MSLKTRSRDSMVSSFEFSLFHRNFTHAENLFDRLIPGLAKSSPAHYVHAIGQWTSFLYEHDTFLWLLKSIWSQRYTGADLKPWITLASILHHPGTRHNPADRPGLQFKHPALYRSLYTISRATHRPTSIQNWTQAYSTMACLIHAMKSGDTDKCLRALYHLRTFFKQTHCLAGLAWTLNLIVRFYAHSQQYSECINTLKQLRTVTNHLPERPYRALECLTIAYAYLRFKKAERARVILKVEDLHRWLPDRNVNIRFQHDLLQLQASLLTPDGIHDLPKWIRTLVKHHPVHRALEYPWTLFLAFLRNHQSRKARQWAKGWFSCEESSPVCFALQTLADISKSPSRILHFIQDHESWLSLWPETLKCQARYYLYLWEVVMSGIGYLQNPSHIPSSTSSSIHAEQKETKQVYAVFDTSTPAISDDAWLRYARKLARSDVPVLIHGETGTGKDHTARWIHQYSQRCHEPFEVINCATIPGTLFESLLFGVCRGAYTGADADRPGIFEKVGKGTVLLDEITEIPPVLQTKLLRVIQESKVRRLGETRERPIACRFLFTTNRNLEEWVEKGKFREDLYYRIGLFQLYLPPLRERPEVIPALVNWFINKYRKETNSHVRGISPDALDYLVNYPWPGNVRELESAVRFALLICGNRSQLDKEAFRLFFEQRSERRERMGVKNVVDFSSYVTIPLGMTLAEARAHLDYVYTLQMLKRHRGQRSATARELGISRTQLYRILNRKQPSPINAMPDDASLLSQ